jgi:hypothetical protein
MLLDALLQHRGVKALLWGSWIESAAVELSENGGGEEEDGADEPRAGRLKASHRNWSLVEAFEGGTTGQDQQNGHDAGKIWEAAEGRELKWIEDLYVC